MRIKWRWTTLGEVGRKVANAGRKPEDRKPPSSGCLVFLAAMLTAMTAIGACLFA